MSALYFVESSLPTFTNCFCSRHNYTCPPTITTMDPSLASSTTNVLNHSSSPRLSHFSTVKNSETTQCLQCHAQTRIDGTLPSMNFWFGFTLWSLEEMREKVDDNAMEWWLTVISVDMIVQ
ncbi:uncharacterized protein LOC121255585 [Juglans microcarpa x Juglans regia]|uniref:uncharacterized protein LOC121255585 n=1 Tax=Juglans microcarpa x Juglans regia TaxID=2249226 RepID=UPI001B7F263D|nr:uncharacterized protein LOC121255585 [Juglans microcarpa x Juglans regia]